MVFVERKIVKYRLDFGSPEYEVVQLYQSNKFQFYRIVASKSPNSQLYKVQLDLLPSDSNEILFVRKDISVLANREENPPYDPHHNAMIEEYQVIVDKPAAKKSHDHIGESSKCSQIWNPVSKQ